ncbi:MAG: helix-turn-helix-domain containing protein AraC type, partial [Rhodospirillales bacterium]|nr:helix-turn-helix-domain containing protein AraC type [Rhodospirillales bacterium]
MDQLATLQHESRRLDRFELFRSSTATDARENVTNALSPHRLLVAPGGQVDVRLNRAHVGNLAVLRLRYGADVAIDPERLDSYVLLQIVLSGRAEMRWGGNRIGLGAGDGVILDTLEGAHLDWSADCEQIIVPLHRSVLVAAADTMFDRVPQRFEFEPSFRIGDESGGALADLVRYLLRQACGRTIAAPLGASLQLLLGQHLLAHHARVGHRPRSTVPRHVRVAEQFMEDHA